MFPKNRTEALKKLQEYGLFGADIQSFIASVQDIPFVAWTRDQAEFFICLLIVGGVDTTRIHFPSVVFDPSKAESSEKPSNFLGFAFAFDSKVESKNLFTLENNDDHDESEN